MKLQWPLLAHNLKREKNISELTMNNKTVNSQLKTTLQPFSSVLQNMHEKFCIRPAAL